jgi:hypothetical protein
MQQNRKYKIIIINTYCLVAAITLRMKKIIRCKLLVFLVVVKYVCVSSITFLEQMFRNAKVIQNLVGEGWW